MKVVKVKWYATAILLVGVTLTAANIYPLNIMVILLGTMGLIYVAIMQGDKQYTVINGVVMVINTIALSSYYL